MSDLNRGFGVFTLLWPFVCCRVHLVLHCYIPQYTHTRNGYFAICLKGQHYKEHFVGSGDSFYGIWSVDGYFREQETFGSESFSRSYFVSAQIEMLFDLNSE